MSRALIRVLYGCKNNLIHEGGRAARSKLDKDIENVLKTEGQAEFYIYVFGQDNYDYLMGKNCKNVVMASKDSYIFKMHGNYVNKMYGWEYALKDFDEIVYLDWDTIQTKPLPDTFWDRFREKECIQTPLYKCRRGVANWRKDYTKRDNKRGTSGGFVYMRDKKIPSELIKLIDDPVIKNFPFGSYSDETYMNLYTDRLGGGWEGKHKYFKLFDPPWCTVEHTEFMENKQAACFHHPIKGK
jgi:hypothetical protein